MITKNFITVLQNIGVCFTKEYKEQNFYDVYLANGEASARLYYTSDKNLAQLIEKIEQTQNQNEMLEINTEIETYIESHPDLDIVNELYISYMENKED